MFITKGCLHLGAPWLQKINQEQRLVSEEGYTVSLMRARFRAYCQPVSWKFLSDIPLRKEADSLDDKIVYVYAPLLCIVAADISVNLTNNM